MIYLEEEDKKYIHICPWNLKKFSFKLRLAINSALAKNVVVLTLSLQTYLILMTGNP